MPDQITGMELNGDKDAPLVIVRCSGRLMKLAAPDLVGILLLYCRQQDIPIPQRSQKQIQHSPAGLTLLLTTDLVAGGVPFADHSAVQRGQTIAIAGHRQGPDPGGGTGG